MKNFEVTGKAEGKPHGRLAILHLPLNTACALSHSCHLTLKGYSVVTYGTSTLLISTLRLLLQAEGLCPPNSLLGSYPPR